MTALTDLAGAKAVAVSVTALLIKFGLEVYREKFKPESVMISRRGKDRSIVSRLVRSHS